MLDDGIAQLHESVRKQARRVLRYGGRNAGEERARRVLRYRSPQCCVETVIKRCCNANSGNAENEIGACIFLLNGKYVLVTMAWTRQVIVRVDL